MAQKNLSHLMLLAVLVLIEPGRLSAADDLQITNDTQSIAVIGSKVTIRGDFKQVELELKNSGSSPLLGVTYLTNKDLLFATYGYGTEVTYTESYLPKDRISPGKTFKAVVTGDLTMIQVTIGCAVFKHGDEGDPLLAERIRADFEGMSVRAKQILKLLDDPANLETKVKALPDIQPSKKLSERGRQAFLYGQQTQKESAIHDIKNLDSLRKRNAEIAEVLQ